MRSLVISFVVFIVISMAFCEQSQGIQSQKPQLAKPAVIPYKKPDFIEPDIFDNPKLSAGLEFTDFDDNRCIQLKQGAKEGVATSTFLDKSAKYDITVFYNDDMDGSSVLKLTVNGKPVGSVVMNATPSKSQPFSSGKKVIHSVDIQKWSEIALHFTGDGNDLCHFQKLTFTPVGAISASTKVLAKPATLQIFEDKAQQLYGRTMLPSFVNDRIDSLMDNRVAELKKFKNPEQWVEQQRKTREQLETFFGKFPERTPLNTKVTGKIEHDKYTIEKLYYESQPGYYVTANLYTPKNLHGPFPGVLLTSGHSSPGKAFSLYHEASLGLVLKGYVVLAIDPMGQGERVEYFDTDTKEPNVPGPVNQHYYLGRPTFLLNRTFSQLRVWDCIRALDYLLSVPGVDTSRIAAVGNSGGGQMALLITAVDKRVKVCAAAHPGGQMENNYLLGQNLIDRQVFSLIAPRPVRIIVGDRSGEEIPHIKKIEDIQLFEEGLGYSKDRAQLVLVDGVHNLELPKRVAMYEWLNKWFGKEEEGTDEAELHPENPKDLLVTPTGLTLTSLGGETGQTLNSKALDRIYKPVSDESELKNRIAKRIGLLTELKADKPETHSIETLHYGDITVKKLTYQSEKGILIPSLLIKPKNIKPGSPVYIYASDRGKPLRFEETAEPFSLAQQGYIVLAIDVRGIGETSPTPELPLPVKYSTCSKYQWVHDCLAIRSPGFGKTMLGMRTFDVMRAVDFLKSQPDLKGRQVVIYGEGVGGLWATLASIYDSRISGVVTEGTLSSYKELVNNQYYAVSSDYFWVPGALSDFDIPDLVRLSANKSQVWINPVNELGEKLSPSSAAAVLGSYKNMKVVFAKNAESFELK